MALSGTNVIFPMATSAAGMSEDFLAMHSQPLWSWPPETLFRVVAYADNDKKGVGIGWSGNNSYSAIFLLDAGYKLGNENRIPSGSIITGVSAQVQIANSPAIPNLDVVVDAALVKRDGKWNNSVSGVGFSTLTIPSAVGLGNTNGWDEIGGRVMLRIRDLGGLAPNRVLTLKNNEVEGQWYWLAWVRYSIADNLTGRLDGYGDTFDSTYTGTIGQLAMRFRRKTGTMPGKYRYELWSTVSGTNDPNSMLAYTSEASLNDIAATFDGATYGLDIVNPASGWEIVSGQRYHVRVSTSGTSVPANHADNTVYPMVAVKGVGEAAFGIAGCTGSGASYTWGNKHWLSHGSYGHRAQWPSLYWEDPLGSIYPDVEPVGGFNSVASGLSGGTLAPTLAYEWGAWVGLSGGYDPLISAIQSWIDDPDYVTSGDQAILAFQLGARDFGGNSTATVSGVRLFISWEPPGCGWFDPLSAPDWKADQVDQDWKADQVDQDWKADRVDQDWKADRVAPDWFVKKECD